VWGTGRVPVGVDTSQTEFNTVEKTGGEKAHTLTIAEMPSHNHSYDLYSGNNMANSGNNVAHGYPEHYNRTYSTGSNGSGQAHNNLQPYITCYMFKRIS
jgi:microcystin-dependent protein